MKILINTISTKKITGGAFQIALNFLLKTLEHPDVQWLYFTSQDVDEVIGEHFNSYRNESYFVFPTQPDFKKTYWSVKNQVESLETRLVPDVIYSITAPSYFKFKAPEVMRFTNPWVTHPNKYAWSTLSYINKLRYLLYTINQKQLMKSAHFFITQTETCARGIRKITNESREHIKVVNNVLPSVFMSVNNTPIKEDNYINIAAVGAAIPHKNFDIIPEVLVELKKLGVNNVRFHLTIAPENHITHTIMAKTLKYGLEEHVINHGRMTQAKLGEMYRRCQLCFLPTLLEVFSASTIEAMYFKLPIVATKFDFNEEVLEDSCLYYTPKNASEAATQLDKLIKDKDLQAVCINKMQMELSKYGNYDAHFNAIKYYLIRIANKEIV